MCLVRFAERGNDFPQNLHWYLLRGGEGGRGEGRVVWYSLRADSQGGQGKGRGRVGWGLTTDMGACW